MVKLEIDTSAIEKRLNEMLARVRHFKSVDIGRMLSDWQTEDMHRHRPFTMRARRKGTASTIIRPHSKKEMMLSRKIAMKARRRHQPGPVRTSTRPILRAELDNELEQRFNDEVARLIHW